MNVETVENVDLEKSGRGRSMMTRLVRTAAVAGLVVGITGAGLVATPASQAHAQEGVLTIGHPIICSRNGVSTGNC